MIELEPQTLTAISDLVGPYCLGLACGVLMLWYARRKPVEVFITDDPRMAHELHLDGHNVRLVTHEEWVESLLERARIDALNAGTDL